MDPTATQTLLRQRLLRLVEKLGISLEEAYARLPHLTEDKTQPYEIKPLEYGESIAGLVDHTLLKPESTLNDLERLLGEAAQHRFACICVNSGRVKDCLELQKEKGTSVAVGGTIGFPLGATSTNIKVLEAQELADLGAKEIDVVMNVGKFKDGNYKYVLDEFKALVQITKKHGIILKVRRNLKS
jgi:deoxyribose-phosphate aldolase